MASTENGITAHPRFAQALARAQGAPGRERVQQAADERAAFLSRYPVTRLAELGLEDYALGHHDEPKESFCWWLEHGTRQFGGIGGGSSHKFVVFKRRATGEFEFPDEFSSAGDAWVATRAALIETLELAQSGRWEEIDEIELLQARSLLRMKLVALYFPEQLLPLFSPAHLERFMKALRIDGVSQSPVINNRRIFGALKEVPALDMLDPVALTEFLYALEDVRDRPESRLRMRCDEATFAQWRERSIVDFPDAAGGDLSQISGVDDLKDVLEHEAGRTQNQITRLLSSLRHVVEDDPGMLVIANADRQHLRGVGLLTGDYEFAVVDGEPRHRLGVRWLDDTQHIFPTDRLSTGASGEVPIFDLPVELLALEDPTLEPAERGTRRDGGSAPNAAAPKPHLYDDVLAGLQQKGQVVLFGPPGTGKTHLARQMAVRLIDEAAGTVPGSTEAPAALAAAEARLGADIVAEDVPPITLVTFHPSYGYEDFVEGWRPADGAGDGLRLELRDGVFALLCEAAHKAPERRVILIIDEINRANVARVFGELITTLESDKRGLTLKLPSGRPFAIPPNLWIIATMNSADRSVRSIDIALRRRFAFVELLPNADRLRSAEVGGLVLGELLDALNKWLVRRGFREQQIGHAFFFRDGAPVSEVEALAQVVRYELLPLLQEYFFDDYGALADLLGNRIVDRERERLNAEVLGDAHDLIRALREALSLESTEPADPDDVGAGGPAIELDEDV